MNAPSRVQALAVRAADLNDPADCARIEAFVADHISGSIFHRPQWCRAVEKGCGQRSQYLVAERGGAMTACLPLTEIRSRLFGNALVSAGFGTGGGIISADEESKAALAEAGWKLAQANNCTSLELRGGALPESWTLCSGTYSNFDRDLPGDDETLFATLPRRQRAEIRKARAFDLDVSFGRSAAHRAAHFRVYCESVRNLGTPVFPKALFDAALDEFGDDAEILIVSKDGRPLATMLSFVHKEVIQPYWGGGTADARTWRANDLAYFEMMRHGIDRGFQRADFGRSKVGTGPWTRKRIWEFEETPLTYAVRTADGAVPRAVNPLDPKYRLKIAAWKKVPLWAANRFGPLIARGLG